MNAPSLHLVQTFVAVVEHHSFARAASALGITPSSVSRFIKTLEQALGTTLLNRTTRAMSLTETGKRYMPNVTRRCCSSTMLPQWCVTNRHCLMAY